MAWLGNSASLKRAGSAPLLPAMGSIDSLATPRASPLAVQSHPFLPRAQSCSLVCTAALETRSSSVQLAGEVTWPAPRLETSTDFLERQYGLPSALEVPSSRDDAIVLLEEIQRRLTLLAAPSGLNVVPFTGGSGPALLACLLATVSDEAPLVCIGGAGCRVPAAEAEHARYIADLLGLDIMELPADMWAQLQKAGPSRNADNLLFGDEVDVAVFSGATADEPLQGAPQLCRPLAGMSRAVVNALAKVIGLPEHSQSLAPAGSADLATAPKQAPRHRRPNQRASPKLVLAK